MDDADDDDEDDDEDEDEDEDDDDEDDEFATRSSSPSMSSSSSSVPFARDDVYVNVDVDSTRRRPSPRHDVVVAATSAIASNMPPLIVLGGATYYGDMPVLFSRSLVG